MSRKKRTTSRILLVEDEESLAVGLEYNLSEERYAVTLAADGKEALEFFSPGQFDLVILDIMLPYLDGFEVAKRLRELSPQIPILMLTARGEIQDRLKGLEIGADDYMTKPFHLDELLLRVKGMLRRAEWYDEKTKRSPLYQLGNCKVNFSNLVCNCGKTQFRLTPHEAMLLKYLVEHKERVISRQELLREVWQIDSEVETRTVDIFIARLRKYFEEDPKKPKFFTSIRSAGYIFRE
jgi:DNA-binding response OmpR family regulator